MKIKSFKYVVVVVCLILTLVAVVYFARTNSVQAQGGVANPAGHILPFNTDGLQFGITQGPRCEGVTPSGMALTHNLNQPSPEMNVEAIDVSMIERTDIVASAAGVVVYPTGQENIHSASENSSFNGEMYIDHPNGYRSIYAHLNERIAEHGEQVNQGEVIGLSGATNTPGGSVPHLHFSIVDRNGGTEVAVPIYNMPGLVWYYHADGYPAPNGTCPTDGQNDGYAQYPLSYCGSAYPGQDAPNTQLFQDAYDGIGGENYIGCAENMAHTAGEGSEQLWLQDFDGGIYNDAAIVHDYNAGATQAYVVYAHYLGGWFNTDYWWQTLGAPVNPVFSDPSRQDFEHGTVYAVLINNEMHGRSVYGNHKAKYDAISGPIGNLGFPTDFQYNAAQSPQGTNGTWQQFERGQIYHSNNFGTFESHGSVYDFYNNYEDGGTRSSLGFPKGDVFLVGVGEGQTYEGGEVYSSSYGTYAVQNKDGFNILDAYVANGGPNNLGLPKEPRGTSGTVAWQRFENNLVYCIPVCGIWPVGTPIDSDLPTVVSINYPNPVYQSLSVELELADMSGVNWATLYVRPQGGNFTQAPMNYNGSRWVASYDVSGFVSGTTVEFVVHAQDGANNTGQVTGLYSTLKQQPTPTVTITEPYEGQLVSGQMGYVAEVTSPVDIERVVIYLYYKTAVDSGYHQESRTIHSPMWGTRKDGRWKVDIDVFGDANVARAIAQNGAYVQAVAYDYQNNETIQQGVRTFPIYINQAPVFVNARTGWNNILKYPNGTNLIAPESAIIKVDYVSGTAYSGTGQPQTPHGDNGVCLNADCPAQQGSKTLVMRTVKTTDPTKISTYFAGHQYVAPTGFHSIVQFALNDNNTWPDNSGGWNLKVSIYPPGTYPADTVVVQVREKAACNPSGCPHIELWFRDSYGTMKFAKDWTKEGDWAVRTINLPAYRIAGWTQVWVNYDNDSTSGGDRNYYLDWIKVDGVVIESDAAGSQYCRGTNYLPFQYTNCIAGQYNMVWSGAAVLPNPN